MNQSQIIADTHAYVQEILGSEATGHDYWHIYRVCKLALHIATTEPADLFVVEMAALLHDIADHKFHNGDREINLTVSRAWIEKQSVPDDTQEHILACIDVCSYSKGKKPESIEAAIVQDADRLDGLGAIGIARVFATGVHFDQIFYNPNQELAEQKTSIGHFHQKIFKLKDQMNTDTAKDIATQRHQYMVDFLDQFHTEWEGER